jgi:hypothetical protein
MSSSLIILRNLAVNFAIVCTLGCLSTAVAQSGRRAPKLKPVAVANPEPTPARTISAETPKPVIRFILGMERYDSFSSVSLNAFSAVRRSCSQRLDEPEWVKVEVLQGPMSRGDAMSRARAEKDSYVVWLRVREDTMSSNQPGTPNNAYIEYAVFSPGTAKVITSGGTYSRHRNKNVILGPSTSGIGGDYYLNKAARDTADRILAAFRLHVHQPSS